MSINEVQYIVSSSMHLLITPATSFLNRDAQLVIITYKDVPCTSCMTTALDEFNNTSTLLQRTSLKVTQQTHLELRTCQFVNEACKFCLHVTGQQSSLPAQISGCTVWLQLTLPPAYHNTAVAALSLLNLPSFLFSKLLHKIQTKKPQGFMAKNHISIHHAQECEKNYRMQRENAFR